VEIVNISMLNFAESLGNHRLFLINVLTRLLLGVYKYKVCRPVSRQLVTSQARSVKRYNEIVPKQFKIHQIKEGLDAVDRITHYCGYPSPPWLRAMVIKLYKQMPKSEFTRRRIAENTTARQQLQPNNTNVV
jgi:hypothetical protein